VLRIVLLILLLYTLPISANKFYYIKLGSFRNWDVLERSINRLPYHMRSHVVVVRLNGWFVPYAYYTSKLYALKKRVYDYRRYFPDARISSSSKILYGRVFRDYRAKNGLSKRVVINSVPQNYIPPPPPTLNSYPKVEETLVSNETIDYPRVDSVLSQIQNIAPKRDNRGSFNRGFSKKMLSGYKFYLAYKSPDGKNDLLIKLSFGNFTVKYQPIIGNMEMREAKYLVENNRLYMFADTFSENGAYSKIEKLTKDYMVVSSWFGGKKINTLRYYYSLDKAKEYLGKSSSDKLVDALEDGEFDKIEQAFIGVDGVYIRSDDEDW